MRYLAFLLLIACGPPGVVNHPTLQGDGGSAKLLEVERPILASLAIVDARLEKRVHQEANEAALRKLAMEAVLQEDTQAAVIEGRIDMFSFDARERALGRLVVPEMDLADASSGELARPKLERELLVRLLDSEKNRTKMEREPGFASEIVRGIVDTWQPAPDEATKTSRDQWLARRLGELQETLAKSPIPRAKQYELEDALDPLESDLGGYKDATAALARLRVALGAQAPQASIPWDTIAKEIAPHVGEVAPADTLRARFESLEKSLRPETQPEDDAQRAVKKLLLEGPAPCALEGKGSLVRALGVPPEREITCRLVRAIASNDPNVKLAMHRVLAVAIATLSKHDAPPGVLQAIPALGVRAAGRPAAFLVAAHAIEILQTDPKSRAQAWLRFGDAPLDVVKRELQ